MDEETEVLTECQCSICGKKIADNEPFLNIPPQKICADCWRDYDG